MLQNQCFSALAPRSVFGAAHCCNWLEPLCVVLLCFATQCLQIAVKWLRQGFGLEGACSCAAHVHGGMFKMPSWIDVIWLSGTLGEACSCCQAEDHERIAAFGIKAVQFCCSPLRLLATVPGGT